MVLGEAAARSDDDTVRRDVGVADVDMRLAGRRVVRIGAAAGGEAEGYAVALRVHFDGVFRRQRHRLRVDLRAFADMHKRGLVALRLDVGAEHREDAAASRFALGEGLVGALRVHREEARRHDRVVVDCGYDFFNAAASAEIRPHHHPTDGADADRHAEALGM